jgi:hypothetical protein
VPCFGSGCDMSKNINVNPGQYKVAGRERQGEDIVHPEERQELSRQERPKKPQAPRIPNQERSSKAPAKRRKRQ